MNDADCVKLLDWLRNLSKLSRAELVAGYSQVNVEDLSLIGAELLGAYWAPNIKTPYDYAEKVYYLADLNKQWSRELGRVIISSSEYYENGDKESAVKALDDFLQKCPVVYLNQNALDCKEYYLSGRHVISSKENKEWIMKTGRMLAEAFGLEMEGKLGEALTLLENFAKICPHEGCLEDIKRNIDRIGKDRKLTDADRTS